ncbi:phosphate acyltransferase PlsX [Caldisalinibacter kiritimatiensis]|uniref:Phosphate acyltransferase n=1 Tax=Caldisalinibacter kiritimatiensis TaxID=1304284 RepID=R1AV90_9FIRM|nr:phosphate acyltransferase PlsX [Caldisalinibacter kiritimatiensis]EOD00557.1 Phosphate:acyl-ACP acyltransferase PlsX [Caldisalinibacter kiritimatiensis]
MKIVVDAMGGDHAPEVTVKGSVDAVKEYGVNVVLVGKEEMIKKELEKYQLDSNKIEIVHAEEVIENEDKPVRAIRRKKDSSMVKGLKLVKEKKADAFISAGNTGALLSGGLFVVGRIKGIERAALAPVYPTSNGISLLLDAGANADCKPKYLHQFAIMGSVYAEKVLGIKRPKVGLINIGTEEGKGNELTKETYKLLKESDLNFYGNIEARELPKGKADVLVCDGFVGNTVLKLTEGLAMEIFSLLKKEITKSFFTKLGALMLKSGLKGFKKRLDYTEYGGAPLLGVKGAVIKAHGSSDAKAIKNAIRQAKVFVENEVLEKIEEDINRLGGKHGKEERG